MSLLAVIIVPWVILTILGFLPVITKDASGRPVSVAGSRTHACCESILGPSAPVSPTLVDAMERHPRLAQMIRALNLGQCSSSKSFWIVKRLLSAATRVDERVSGIPT